MLKREKRKKSLYAKYKLFRSKVAFEIRKSKQRYYRNVISENVGIKQAAYQALEGIKTSASTGEILCRNTRTKRYWLDERCLTPRKAL